MRLWRIAATRQYATMPSMASPHHRGSHPHRPGRRSIHHIVLLLACALLPAAKAGAVESAPAPTTARPFLSPIFSDHMVLQRGKPNTFWGWTTPGAVVRVEIDGHTGRAVAGADGRWQAQVTPPPIGTECVVTIDGPQHLELHDVIVGDVWLCGGQSNMEFGLPRAQDGAREVAAANHPAIRLFTVPSHPAYAPTTVPVGTWKVCTPQTVSANGGFSAVAYFFACRVQAETGVPIGLIQDCLGGTPVESWMDPATLREMKDFDRPMAEVERLRASHGPEYGNYVMHWYDEYDAGIRGADWADPNLDDRAWKTVHLPGGFEEFGLADVPAVVWFRREIVLPDPLPAGDAVFHLGVVEKMDTTYVNGNWVGASSWVENPRAYHVPAAYFKPGRNLITIRVFKLKSKTGFLSPPDHLNLAFAGGPEIPLAGVWKGAVSVDARPPHSLPLGYENYPIMPSVLYQGMIRPILPLALTGFLWYQGEANAGRAHQYRTLLPALIRDWRRAFQQGDLPFLVVSLPAFQPHLDQPGTDGWAELREAQALAAGTVPNCGLAVTIDTGEADNIHPTQKKIVGARLALNALDLCYGRNVPYQGPTYRSFERDGSSLRIHFDHCDGGLKCRGDKLGEFSVAGPDRQWHWAEARIEGDTVVVASAGVPDPVAVRYAWQSNPLATLYNGAGLPAVPFRSDDWPGVTDNAKPW
jgi:sialate O-acetylesterase